MAPPLDASRASPPTNRGSLMRTSFHARPRPRYTGKTARTTGLAPSGRSRDAHFPRCVRAPYFLEVEDGRETRHPAATLMKALDQGKAGTRTMPRSTWTRARSEDINAVEDFGAVVLPSPRRVVISSPNTDSARSTVGSSAAAFHHPGGEVEPRTTFSRACRISGRTA